MKRTTNALLVAAVLTAVSLNAPQSQADDPMIYLAPTLVEVNLEKLRRVGVDWTAVLGLEGVEGDLQRFIDLLADNNLARTRAAPQLLVVSGRKVEFDVSTLTVTATPRVVDGRIAVNLSIASYDEPAPQRAKDRSARGELAVSLTTKAILNPGEKKCVSHISGYYVNPRGELEETVTYLFVLADTKPPQDTGKADPRGTSIEATSRIPPIGSTPRR